MMEYQITDGPQRGGCHHLPEDGLEEGMKTVVSTDGSLGQSKIRPAAKMTEMMDDGMLDNDDGNGRRRV